MRKTTRQKTLEIISRRQAISAVELGNVLGLTIASVRHQLHELLKESLIEIIDQKKGPRGRPTNIYGLSDQVLSDGRKQLLLVALEELFSSVDEKTQNKIIRRMAARLVNKLGRGDPGLGPQQLTVALEKLRNFHYFPHWQASPSGAQIIFTRCPYKSIIHHYPQLCRYDTFILEELFGTRADLVEKIISPGEGLKHCLFQLYETIQS